jgi:hypothetical protein
VMYHQHIPRPDPLTNDDTLARWKFVAGRGVPTYIIDGQKEYGGGPRSEAVGMEKTLRAAIDKRLEAPAEARLSLQASRDGKTMRVRANASGIKSDSPDVKLRIVLVEKLIRFAGENGIRFHPMVVRAASGFAFDGAKSTETSETFDLDQVRAKLKAHIDRFETKNERHNPDGKFRFAETKYDIDENRLAVVAYLEDQKTKAILQAAYVEAK